MRTPTLLALGMVLALLLAAAPAHAHDWTIESFQKQAQQSDWEGFGVGTSYTTKTAATSPMGTRNSEERKTLMKIEAEHVVIKTEQKQADGTWKEVKTDKIPRKKKVTFEMKDAGAEKVKVGETEYDCKLVEGVKTEDGKSEKARFWVHDAKGILQMEMPAGPGMMIKMTVTKLDYEKTIGETTLKNVRSFTASFPGGTIVMEVGLDSPEQMLSQKMSMQQQGMSMTQDAEMTALTIKKKEAAVTTK